MFLHVHLQATLQRMPDSSLGEGAHRLPASTGLCFLTTSLEVYSVRRPLTLRGVRSEGTCPLSNTRWRPKVVELIAGSFLSELALSRVCQKRAPSRCVSRHHVCGACGSVCDGANKKNFGRGRATDGCLSCSDSSWDPQGAFFRVPDFPCQDSRRLFQKWIGSLDIQMNFKIHCTAGSKSARSRSACQQFVVAHSSGIHFQVHSSFANGDVQIRVRPC